MALTPSLQALFRCSLFAAFVLAAAVSASPATAGDAKAGKAKARVCAICHGIDGLARRPDAPHLAGGNEIYLAGQLRAYRAGKRTHPVMSIIAAGLSDEDIGDLAAWYASIGITVKMPD